MSNNSESSITKQLKDLFRENNLSPDHVGEFFCKPNQVEIVKKEIRKKTNDKCCFFTKELKNEVHIIALVNISNIKELLKNTTTSDILKNSNYSESELSIKNYKTVDNIPVNQMTFNIKGK